MSSRPKQETSAEMVDAVVLGGGPPQPDAVCRYAGVDRKSLIPIASRKMILYVLQALADSGRVRRAIIVGLSRDHLSDSPLPLPADFVAEGRSLLPSVEAGLAIATGDRVLFCASDIPLLTGAAIQDFLARCAEVEADIYYAVVERSVMERRFPQSGRHYRPLRDGAFAGGDVLLVNPRAFLASGEWFARMFAARKSCLRLTALFGWTTLLSFLLRRLTIADAEKRIGAALGCRCKAIVSPFPEIAMDVDTIRQLHRLAALLAAQ